MSIALYLFDWLRLVLTNLGVIMSLVSVSVLKEYLPEIQGAGADTELSNLIERAEAVIARFLGLPVNDSGTTALTASTYTLYINSPNYSDRSVLQLPIKPIISITSVYSDLDREYTADTEIGSDEYTLDTKLAQIILKPNVATIGFNDGYRANRVICSAGYDTDYTDLIHAVCVYCSHIYRAKASQGKKTTTIRNASTTFSPNTLPPECKEILYQLRSSSMIM